MTTEPVIEKWGPYELVWLNSESESRDLLFAKSKHLGVGVAAHKGYKGLYLDFLLKNNWIKTLVVFYSKGISAKCIEAAWWLENLVFIEGAPSINLARHELLREFRTTWTNQLQWPHQTGNLNLVYLRNFSPTSQDLSTIPPLKNLRSFEVVMGNVKSLNGIERFDKVESLQLSYLKNLSSIDDLRDLKRLRLLHLEKCKSISSFQCLSQCVDLEVIRVLDCGEIRDLKFAESLKSLREFRHFRTSIPPLALKDLARVPVVAG